MDWQALAVSFRLAISTAVVLFFIAVPIAAWLTFSARRWRVLTEAFLMLPFVLPPTVLGFYLLVLLSPAGLAFQFSAILIGSVILNLPIAVQAFTEAFKNVDRSLIEAMLSLGASRMQTFRRLVLPMSWPGVLSGLTLSFAHTFGEFGVAMMVGGNLQGETRTMSIAIYDSVQSFNERTAHLTALTQILICFVLLAGVAVLKTRLRPV